MLFQRLASKIVLAAGGAGLGAVATTAVAADAALGMGSEKVLFAIIGLSTLVVTFMLAVVKMLQDWLKQQKFQRGPERPDASGTRAYDSIARRMEALERTAERERESIDKRLDRLTEITEDLRDGQLKLTALIQERLAG